MIGILLIIIGVYQMSISLLLTTHNVWSTLVARVMPFLCGGFIAVVGLHLSNIITLNI